MRARPPALAVRCAYLELTEPDLPTVASELVGLDLTAVRIVPMFLGAGRHVREDLPALVADLRLRHPQVQWDLQPPVGEDDRLLDMLAHLATGAT
jgi:sirohydrochlorin cobaltochelatase